MPSILKNRGIISPKEKKLIPEFDKPQPIEQKEEIDLSSEGFRPLEFKSEEETDKQELEEQEINEDKEIVYQMITPTKEDIKTHFSAELEEVVNEVRNSAVNDVVFKKKGELVECVEKVDATLKDIERTHKEFLAKFSEELKFLSIEIAEKMILKKIEEDDLVLEKLVINTVNGVKNTAWLDVELSEKLVVLIDKIRTEITTVQGRTTVTPISASIDTCRVNTEEGTIVSTISAQADNLRRLFSESSE